MITRNEENNTGEPFYITNGGVLTDSDGEKTIKAVAYDTSVYVPFDIRFIPNDIPRSKLLNNMGFTVNIGSISASPASDHYIELRDALESGDLNTISIRGKRESNGSIGKYPIKVDQHSYITHSSIKTPSGSYINRIEIYAKYDNVYWFEGDDHAIICNNTYGPLNDDKMLYLKSSTEGSKKQFRITVDDSGTISATEVT